VITAADAVLLAGAGALAALAGTAGGITSLISYPALLLAGVPPLPANIVNVVSLVVCWPGSAAASRPELRGRGRWLARWAPVAALGGAAGAVLLVSTPPGVFSRVVPFLLAAAALALLFQPRISAWLDRTERRAGALVLAAGLFAVSAYNGYFGAGAGVMLLALMLLTTDQDLARANALKNWLLGPASVVAAITFILLGPVDWSAVAPLAAGMLVGSVAGPQVTRRMPPGLLRWLVALTGLGVAVRLWAVPAF
jgi:uncharacterized protein